MSFLLDHLKHQRSSSIYRIGLLSPPYNQACTLIIIHANSWVLLLFFFCLLLLHSFHWAPGCLSEPSLGLLGASWGRCLLASEQPVNLSPFGGVQWAPEAVPPGLPFPCLWFLAWCPSRCFWSFGHVTGTLTRQSFSARVHTKSPAEGRAFLREQEGSHHWSRLHFPQKFWQLSPPNWNLNVEDGKS